MSDSLVGKKVLIHCYKHDGSIHRCWAKGFILDENDDHFIAINNRTLVLNLMVECGIQESLPSVIFLKLSGTM